MCFQERFLNDVGRIDLGLERGIELKAGEQAQIIPVEPRGWRLALASSAIRASLKV